MALEPASDRGPAARTVHIVSRVTLKMGKMASRKCKKEVRLQVQPQSRRRHRKRDSQHAQPYGPSNPPQHNEQHTT